MESCPPARAVRSATAIAPSTRQPPHLYYALALCFEVQMTATLDVPGPALPEQLDLSDPADTARYAAVLPAFFDDETMIDEVRAFDASDRMRRTGAMRAASTAAMPE